MTTTYHMILEVSEQRFMGWVFCKDTKPETCEWSIYQQYHKRWLCKASESHDCLFRKTGWEAYQNK